MHWLVQLEEKERAYLQILSDEMQQRDKERERAVDAKLAELRRQESQLKTERAKVTQREQQLNDLKVEVRFFSIINLYRVV